MSSIAISAIAFGCIVGGALLGRFLRRTLLEHITTGHSPVVNAPLQQRLSVVVQTPARREADKRCYGTSESSSPPPTPERRGVQRTAQMAIEVRRRGEI